MRIKKTCKRCGKIFYIKPSYAKLGYGKYCSITCYKSKKEIKCQRCGKLFWAYPYQIKAGRKYCSRKCFIRSEERKCSVCGKVFLVEPNRLKRNVVKYCSRKCQAKGFSLAAKRHQARIVCKNCGRIFWITKKLKHYGKYTRGFCSRKCFNEDRGLPIEKTCKECGNLFKATPSRIKLGFGVYCSLKCRDIAMSGERGTNWQGGIARLPYNFNFNNSLKNDIKERDGLICQECLKRKIKSNLRIHHIDYDKMNSNPRNLISLCKNCHAKTTVGNRKYWIRYYERKINAIYKKLAKVI